MKASAYEYAGFGRRLAAFCIDYLLYVLFVVLILGPGFVNTAFLSLEGIAKKVFVIGVMVFCWGRFQGTPGKLLMGCQLVDANSFSSIGPRQALIRIAAYVLSAVPLFLGFLMIAWDKRRQGLHDKLANTVVLYNANLVNDDESQKSLQQLLSELR